MGQDYHKNSCSDTHTCTRFCFFVFFKGGGETKNEEKKLYRQDQKSFQIFSSCYLQVSTWKPAPHPECWWSTTDYNNIPKHTNLLSKQIRPKLLYTYAPIRISRNPTYLLTQDKQCITVHILTAVVVVWCQPLIRSGCSITEKIQVWAITEAQVFSLPKTITCVMSPPYAWWCLLMF